MLNFSIAKSRCIVDKTELQPERVQMLTNRIRGLGLFLMTVGGALAETADEKIAAWLDGATVRRVVAVPGRLVNFVLG